VVRVPKEGSGVREIAGAIVRRRMVHLTHSVSRLEIRECCI
jgi:hypothetical protein